MTVITNLCDAAAIMKLFINRTHVQLDMYA